MKVRNHKLVDNDNRNVPFVSTPNQGGKLAGNRPRFLVMHYTAGGTASSAIDRFKDPAADVSAHLVIGSGGAITQMVSFDTVGWHAGRSRWRNVKGVNSHSVGIELVNWGLLKKTGSGGWASWTGKAVPADRVVLEEHKNSPGRIEGWEAFDEAQMDAAVDAAQAIVREYDIGPWDLVGHDDVSPIRKVDPGPAFDMDRFRARVFGRSEDAWDDLLFKVNSDTGLNLRTDPAITGRLIKNLADGTVVHVIEQQGNWWLVAEVIDGNDDVTGFVHKHWLQPA